MNENEEASFSHDTHPLWFVVNMEESVDVLAQVDTRELEHKT